MSLQMYMFEHQKCIRTSKTLGSSFKKKSPLTTSLKAWLLVLIAVGR